MTPKATSEAAKKAALKIWNRAGNVAGQKLSRAMLDLWGEEVQSAIDEALRPVEDSRDRLIEEIEPLRRREAARAEPTTAKDLGCSATTPLTLDMQREQTGEAFGYFDKWWIANHAKVSDYLNDGRHSDLCWFVFKAGRESVISSV